MFKTFTSLLFLLFSTLFAQGQNTTKQQKQQWVEATPDMALARLAKLPERTAPRPKTTKGVPHVQIDVQAKAELTEQLLRHVARFPAVTLGPTRVSLPGATGFQLAQNIKLAQPQAIVGGREFAHIHPDGSLHASLHPQIAKTAIEAGWAIAHPWSQKRDGWQGFVMLYTPQTQNELNMVLQLIESSYIYVTGRLLP